MPITVSCPACGSRFSLSDDLYRRRVVGSLVKVKCRTCSAEIAVDATDPAMTTSQEAPRKHPSPPRPKAITQMGLGTPPPAAALATESPLPFELPQPPLPLNATVTPLPVNGATATPQPITDPDSSWSEEQTIAINLATQKAPPRPPARTAPTLDEAEEPELVDAEEIPVSSSGAPTLDALTLEAGGAHVPHGRPAPDEFLVSLSTGNRDSLGAPTIDVTSFASELNPPSVDVALASEDASEDPELEYRPARGTVPQFDMNAVLPAASPTTRPQRVGLAPVPPREPAGEPPLSEGRSRERKFVIAPQAADTADEAPKARRSSALLWVGLLAAAAAVAALIGSRGERWTVAEELKQAATPVTAPVVNTQAALPAAEAAAAETSEAPPASAQALASAAPAPIQNVAVATTRNVAPSTTAAVKSSANADSTGPDQVGSSAESAVEKPVLANSKPFEAHNAPPPAAPDTEFDRAAARNALTSAAAQASACRKEGDPSGTANLTITFAPSGRVTSAQIQGPPFSGTPTGGCIASTMRKASVPAFSGDYVTVSKTIVVQ
ncbi:MAG TPA: hypothetical protein VGC79_20705 [Polyangiaceae bacterium]